MYELQQRRTAFVGRSDVTSWNALSAAASERCLVAVV